MAQFLDLTGLTRYKNKSDALYAKQDGSYESMTVGNAEQLVSTVGVSDSAPYTFRTTGGSADVGDRMNLKAVVGGTVAWNQLVQNGNFNGNTTNWTSSGSATRTVSNNVLTITSSAINSIQQTLPLANANGHRILFCGTVSATESVNFGIYKNSSGTYATAISPADGTKVRIERIVTISAVSTDTFDIRIRANTTNSTTITVENVNVFDLTAMFGSTIADYIYTLEQGTAGAGVAYFRKLFPKPYYAYNSGELLSVQTSVHKMVGFNQFDEVCESGYINISTGENDDSFLDTRYRSKNYIRVVPNTTYYYKASVSQTNNSVKARIYFYDASKSFISSVLTSAVSDTFTTPSNCGFIRFFVNQALSTYNHDICINLHWDGERDGEYEPYEEHTYALDDVELRGILKLDASNNLYADGDRYLPDGTVIRKRRQMVADGDTVKATSVNQSNGTYYCVLTTLSSANKGVDSTTTETRIITDKGYRDYPSVGVGHIYITNDGISPIICLFDQTLTTVSAVNTYLASNPITIEYELATPTTESADAYTELQICDDFGTEEFVDAATRDFAMPVGHNTVYQPNLRAKLEMAPNSPDGDGDYLVRQTNGTNEYVLFSEVKELPDMPTEDGTYVLKCTVADGTATLSWVTE